MEDKKAFVEEFGNLLAKHGAGDVAKMEYVKTETSESVYIYFWGGGKAAVNVHMDSIPALIRDVMKCI